MLHPIRKQSGKGKVGTKGNAYKAEPEVKENLFFTPREKMLTAASQLGYTFFREQRGTDELPDPVKCDVDMMEAFNQGYAIAKLNVLGYSRYTVGTA